MGLSLEECEKLGIAAEHPDHPSRRVDAPKLKHVPKVNERGQNKGEAELDHYLEDMKRWGRIRDYRFEPLKLRLAGRCYYTPDFVVMLKDGSFAVLEYKGGFIRDDAAVKTKTAAEQFAWFGLFYLVRRDRACEAGWDIRRVDRTGFGLIPIGSDWMLGPRDL